MADQCSFASGFLVDSRANDSVRCRERREQVAIEVTMLLLRFSRNGAGGSQGGVLGF